MRTAIWLGLVACRDESEEAPAPVEHEITPVEEITADWEGICQPAGELTEELVLELNLWEGEVVQLEGNGFVAMNGQALDEGLPLEVDGSVDDTRSFELELEMDSGYSTLVWSAVLVGQLQDGAITAELVIGPFEGVSESLTLSCALVRE
jgi:hypothetical protein